MTFRRWMNENRELSKKRMDMLIERFSVQELIEYRDNYARNRKVICNILMVLTLIIFAAMLIVCIFEKTGLTDTETCNLYLGYFFGVGVSLMLFAPSGSYERKLSERIEKRCLKELELRK